MHDKTSRCNKVLLKFYYMFVCFLKSFVLIALTLFLFDLTPDKCNGSHLHENSTGIVDLEILFSKPLEEAITVLCYTAHESIIAITKERGVLTS